MRSLILNLILGSSLALGGAAMAAEAQEGEVYRWVDDDGSVHYSDQPPPQGTDAETVRVANPPPSPVSSDDAEEEAAPEIDLDDPVMQRQCSLAQEILSSYLSANQLVQRDRDGTERVLSPDERQEEIAKAQRQVNQFCPSGMIAPPTP